MEDVETILSDCESRKSKLSPWEADFIASIREQFDRRGSISEKQSEVLNKIWDRIT